MSRSFSPSVIEPSLAPNGRNRWHASPSRWLIHRIFARLRRGQLVLIDNGKCTVFGEQGATSDLSATVIVHDPRAYWELATSGTTGGGRAYVRGWWSSTDLVRLVRLVIRNRHVLFGLEEGPARAGQFLLALYHRLRRNSRAGSRRNIEAHYDLGNDFFGLLLDETLGYSCALFHRPDMTLGEATEAKYDLICRKLELGPHDHLLEIGTGWGGLAIHAALNYGCRVTTTTISAKQHAFAWRRVRESGLSERIRVLDKDYRDLDGRYDKLVSIEMIEAVGDRYYPTYFRACARLLKPGGTMLLQAITVPDDYFSQAKQGCDFIKHFVFPGSTIPSIEAIRRASERELELTHVEDISEHYVWTLRRWRRNLHRNVDRIRVLGHSSEFIRTWDYYFAYCEAGFHERHTGDFQMLFVKRPCVTATPPEPALVTCPAPPIDGHEPTAQLTELPARLV